MSKLGALLNELDRQNNKEEIAKVLDLCDLIYYSGREHVYIQSDKTTMRFGPQDLPDDEQYDAMRTKYTPNVKPGDNLVSKDIPSEDKVKHRYAMGSLKKYRANDIADLQSLFSHTDEIILMEKLDGMSTRCTFKNGILYLALTRHNREYGRNVTRKVSKIIPRLPGNITINGELMYVGDSYLKLGMATRRNAVSGILGRDDANIHDYKDIYYFAYEIVSAEESQQLSDQVEVLEMFKRYGFRIPKYEIITKDKLTAAYLKDRIIKWKEASSDEYDIDGAVISPRIYTFENEDEPTMKVAYKIQLEGKWSEVLEIKPICTRQGFVIPHITVRAVIIDGVRVTSITGSNYSILAKKQIVPGSKVYVIRSNDVIPFISEVDNSIVLEKGEETIQELIHKIVPTKCPCCNTTLIKQPTQHGEGEMLYCPNESCPAKISEGIIHFFITIGVEGFGKKLIGSINAESIEEVYGLSIKQLESIEGFGKDRAADFYEQIRSKLIGLEDARLLAAMGISMINIKTATLITNEMDLTEIFFRPHPFDKLVAINGVGRGKAQNIVDFIPRGRAIIQFLKSQGMKLSKRKAAIRAKPDVAGKKFVLTGTGKLTRPEYERKIMEAGGKVTSSVSSATDYLVAENPNGTSTKIKKAKELKIKIITYDDLHKMLELD